MADEVHRLRGALRDLVALSAIPAAWVGRDPAAIATGLTDVLIGTLHLDFAFVRLTGTHDGVRIDVTRGNAWSAFPEWLEGQRATLWRRSPKAIVQKIEGGAEPSRGVVLPIGINGIGGVLAAASRRADFPTETEQLLLSVAANEAATAFHNARLIEERRHTESALREARDELEKKVMDRTRELDRVGAELETILDASPIGMVLFDRDGNVQRCNAAFERLLGWTSREIVGRRIPLWDRIEEWSSALAPHLGSSRGFSGLEIRIAGKDGSEFDAAVACAALTDEQGRPAGLVANVDDVSHRKRAEEGLRRAQADLAHVTRVSTLGELAASIAHEVYQPLAAIGVNATASLNVLDKPTPDVPMVREALADIVMDARRAAHVIQRIRELVTKSDPQKQPLNLNEVILEAATLVRSEVGKHQATLKLALAPTLPAVWGDRVQIEQVIINLVMNGLEAMISLHDRARELVIRSEAVEPRRVRVTIEDEGVGLDPRHMDQLFNAFFTTKPGGMGMGLSISRTIIETHGGRLWATPNQGQGARFAFELAASCEANASKKTPIG
jgi:PAS domain S-box-containing protein